MYAINQVSFTCPSVVREGFPGLRRPVRQFMNIMALYEALGRAPPQPGLGVSSRAFDQDRQPGLDPCAAGRGMFVGTPAAQLGRSFGHGCKTHSRGIGIGRDADAVVVDFDGETVVHAAYPDSNPLRAGMFCRVADGLLRDAVGRDLDRCREYREITRDLESNGRRALPPITALSSACC